MSKMGLIWWVFLPNTDGTPFHPIVAVVKSYKIDGLNETNVMPIWWHISHWWKQNPWEQASIYAVLTFKVFITQPLQKLRNPGPPTKLLDSNFREWQNLEFRNSIWNSDNFHWKKLETPLHVFFCEKSEFFFQFQNSANCMCRNLVEDLLYMGVSMISHSGTYDNVNLNFQCQAPFATRCSRQKKV